MEYQFYTLATWHVAEGQEEEFVRIWREDLGRAFLAANARATGTLIQSLEDPRQYYSFGPWHTLEEIHQVRSDQAVGAAIAKLISLCDHAKPGAFRVVLHVS
jgi:hypothetical protein